MPTRSAQNADFYGNLRQIRIPGLYKKVPELCRCFCGSDDITYAGLHPTLYWYRTKTLWRGIDCCDFCLKRTDK